MKDFKLRKFYFSPGYGDMLGGCHSKTVRMNKTGEWVFEVSEREDHRSPTILTTYEVLPDKLSGLEAFIEKKGILSLEKRPKSNVFITDYSPWSYGIEYTKTSFGKTTRCYCSFSQYRKYSPHDYDLMEELRGRFEALRGEKIAEIIEKDGDD
ncbi:MAG: hypothetical protein K6G89_07835 [Clostridia bacterium]|nr:hypothetical protein [Clostridia bacterium]